MIAKLEKEKETLINTDMDMKTKNVQLENNEGNGTDKNDIDNQEICEKLFKDVVF